MKCLECFYQWKMVLEYDHPQEVKDPETLLVVWWKSQIPFIRSVYHWFVDLLIWAEKNQRLRRWYWRQQVFDARGFHISWRPGHSLGRFFFVERFGIAMSATCPFFWTTNAHHDIYLDFVFFALGPFFVEKIHLALSELLESWVWGVFGVHGLAGLFGSGCYFSNSAVIIVFVGGTGTGSSLAVGASGRCHLECPWLKDATTFVA